MTLSTPFLALALALPWIVVALFLALGAWIGFQLIQQNGRLLARLETLEARLTQSSALPAAPPVGAPLVGALTPPAPQPSLPAGLPLGAPAPAFELPDLTDARRSLAEFRGRKLLIVFFNPRCGFCTQMAPDLAALPVDGNGGDRLPLVISTGDREENRRLVAEHGIRCPVLLQEQMEVASQYQCHGTPMGYLVDEQGNIASGLAVGAQALLALAGDGSRETAVGSRNGHADPPRNGHEAGALGGTRALSESKLERNGLPAGTPAPDFTLPLLHGGELSLAAYRGRPVLLVFSDPHCGPCDELMPPLEQQHRTGAGVQILMVSRGEADANRAKAAQHGLTLPILLQRQWEISREYGMFATPIAYLIDEAGVIERDVAVGVEPILALLARAAAAPNDNGKLTRSPAANGARRGSRGKEAAARRR